MGSLTEFGEFLKENKPIIRFAWIDSFDIDGMEVSKLEERLQRIDVDTYKEGLLLDKIYLEVDEYTPTSVSIMAMYKETPTDHKKRCEQEWPAEKLRREQLRAARKIHLSSSEDKIKENDLLTLELLAKKYGKTIS